jgi:hypothetical protein
MRATTGTARRFCPGADGADTADRISYPIAGGAPGVRMSRGPHPLRKDPRRGWGVPPGPLEPRPRARASSNCHENGRRLTPRLSGSSCTRSDADPVKGRGSSIERRSPSVARRAAMLVMARRGAAHFAMGWPLGSCARTSRPCPGRAAAVGASIMVPQQHGSSTAVLQRGRATVALSHPQTLVSAVVTPWRSRLWAARGVAGLQKVWRAWEAAGGQSGAAGGLVGRPGAAEGAEHYQTGV